MGAILIQAATAMWHMCEFECRYPQRLEKMSDHMELELQVVVNHVIWELGKELWSSERAVYTPNQ